MLSLPLFLAAASAGVVGGIHCVGMCGGLAHMLAVPPRAVAPTGRVIMLQTVPLASGNQHQLWLHAGRLSLYTLLGGLMGGLGAAGIWLAPTAWLQQSLFVLGNLALLMLGLRLLHPTLLGGVVAWLKPRSMPASLALPWQSWQQAARGILARGQQHPFLLGLAWGCLPCGLLYAVLPFALLSGAAWSGAILMLVFGLCSLPHLLLAGSAGQLGRRLRITLALVLLALGVFGLLHYDMRDMPQWLCVTPA